MSRAIGSKFPHAEETKLKISNSLIGNTRASANRGRELSEETKLKISNACKGRSFTAEHRLKLSQARLGKSPSEETRRKLSSASAKAVAEGKLANNGKYNPQPYTDRFGRTTTFKNTWEYGAAVYIDTQGWIWVYEQAPIHLNGETYLPDFFIWDNEGDLVKVIEVKGRYEESIKEKMQRFKAYFESCGIEWELWDGKKLKQLGILSNIHDKFLLSPMGLRHNKLTDFVAILNGGNV